MHQKISRFISLIKIKKLLKILNKVRCLLEVGAKKLLKKANKKKLFFYENDLSNISKSKYIIICIGTPIDKRLKPNLISFYGLIKKLKNRINNKQILIIRSSVLPGTNQKIKEIL